MSRLRTSPFRSGLALAFALTLALSACSSDGAGSAGGTDSSTTSSAGEQPAVDVSAPVADAPGADVPAEGTPIAEVDISADGVEAPDELQKALTVLGFDKPGYVSGTTIVAQPAAGEDRQFVCIAAGQLDLVTYRIVVLDEEGTVLDC